MFINSKNLKKKTFYLIHNIQLTIIHNTQVFEYPNQVIMVTELVPGGELFDKIVEIGAYSEADAGKIVKQVVDGVQVR